jgi:Ca2+-binding RTX toxin-like protein
MPERLTCPCCERRVTAIAGGAVVSAAQPTLTCNGLPATIVGTDDDDTLNGTPGPHVIAGLGGNDTIHGNGDDVVIGGPAATPCTVIVGTISSSATSATTP